MRAGGLLVGVALAAVALPVPLAAHPAVIQFRKSSRGSTTEASVEVHGTVARVYAVITDYARWSEHFADVKWAKVKSGGREDAVVELASRALGHTVTIKFSNEAPRTIRFKLVKGPKPARARGELLLDDMGGGVVRIQAALYMDAVGFIGFFVPSSTLRKKRKAKLQSDLTDLVRWFPHTTSPGRK